MLISWTGTWKQTVGAQWLVVHGPNAPALVSLVQAANTLPMMLLALPGGVLADSFDRRWLLLTVQAYFFVAGTLLAVLTAAGQMPPALLLLPVIASRRLGQGADGYGALFGALGAGAIVGALVLGRVRAGLSTNGMLVAAGVVYGAAMAVIILVPSFLAALAILVVAGLAWMAATSTLDAELQLVLPVWVRARGLSIYTVTFQGSQAAGALIWGLVANQVGLQPAILVAAVVLLAGVIAGMVWRIPETGHLDPEPATPYWTDPRLAFDPEPAAGPVIVALEFTVEPEREAAFLGGDGSTSRDSTQNRGDALGAVQGRRATESLCRDVQHSVLGGAHAPASWPPLDGDGQRDRGSRPRFSDPISAGAAPASTVALKSRFRRQALVRMITSVLQKLDRFRNRRRPSDRHCDLLHRPERHRATLEGSC